jgi:hypothetical protein
MNNDNTKQKPTRPTVTIEDVNRVLEVGRLLLSVLAQRTADGMEAKLPNGGWPQKAPDGYVNKERHVSNNKYERWVEKDPDTNQVIRQAWGLTRTAFPMILGHTHQWGQ